MSSSASTELSNGDCLDGLANVQSPNAPASEPGRCRDRRTDFRPPRRLLILSCSKRKLPTPGPLSAVQRYDGPAFRVLRRFLRNRPWNTPDVYILSAKYGLIPDTHGIGDYDQRMTPERARELQPAVLRALARIMSTDDYTNVCLSLGRAYWLAFQGYETLISGGAKLSIAGGPQGKKLAALHNWLHGGQAPPRRRKMHRSSRRNRPVRLRGVELPYTPEQVFERARHSLAEGIGEPDRFLRYYVLVDGQRVAAKWLASQLSGLATSRFVATEARRVLDQLGVLVRDLRHQEPR